MEILNLELANFRNYKTAFVKFFDGINIIVGNNAQGKTNLLESIYFCALGKSPKNVKEKQVIKFNESFSKININFLTQAGKKNIIVNLFENNKKNIKVNNLPILKLSSLVGELSVVYFSPDELKLVKEVPEDRRKFLDIAISQFDKIYLNALIKYDKILRQRNCILKNNIPIQSKKEQLQLFTPQLIKTALIIITKRLYFVEQLKKYCQNIHNQLAADEIVDIEYSFKIDNNLILEQQLTKSFEQSLEKELKLGFTTVGPHRDDLIFKINGKDCRYFSSQGQQRTLALSLILTNMEIVFNETKEYPVLLLDDVLSELDNKRKDNLLNCVKKYQTLLTCTNFDFEKHKFKQIRVANGTILV